MEFRQIIYTVEDGIATITLNRPENLNAFTPVMTEEIYQAIETAKRDDDVKVLVITGAGRAFCAGADVKGLASRDHRSMRPAADASVVELMGRGRRGIQRIPRALEDFEKPYIASVNGPAAGGGMDLASMADIRIASDRARFGITHLRMGQISMDGGCYFLQRIIGIPRTLELAWTSRIFDAQEALQIGYVNKVVPHEHLADETRALATQLARGPGVAIRVAKRLVYKAHESTLDEALEEAEWAVLITEKTEDAKEGPRAWVEKREPQFKGR